MESLHEICFCSIKRFILKGKAIRCGVDQVHIYRNGTKVFGEFGIIDVINSPCSILELSDEEYELRIRYQRDIAEIESKALELSRAK